MDHPRQWSSTGDPWTIFKAQLDEAARQVADPVVAAYAGKLAAVDAFTVDNAFEMLESQGIDAGVLGPFGIRP